MKFSFETFTNKYNYKRINHASKIVDWKTFEKNNPTIALNILYIKEKEMCSGYISNTNSNFEKQVILVKIPNEKKECWCYLAVKELSTLSREITPKYGNFYCLDCIHSFGTENKM